jgi:peptidyl-prolyl cis-trans isomerase D
MIQDLRKYTDSFLFKLLLGFISVTFVISFGMGSFFGDRKEVIARVDETEILQRDFQRMYGQQLESLRQRLGENADQIAQQVNLRQQVFQQLIDRQLLLNMAESLNLRATDLEVQEYIRQQPYFQKNGQFDFETYETLLSQNRLPTEDYEESIRLDLLLQKKQQLLTAGIIISEKDVEQRFQLQNEKLEVRTLQLLPQVFLDEVSVSEEQAQQYYQENPDEFQTLPRYRLAYFTLGINDLMKVEDVRERAVRRYYERNIETYTTPPEVRARHILFRVPGDADDAAKAERREQLQEVRERIVAGADFAEEAKEVSQDMTKEKGGDLGWFKPGEMVPAFESAAFGLQPGEMSDIVESPFGLHLIKVEERREGGQQPIEEVREEIVAILAEEMAQRELEEARDTFRATFNEKSISDWAAQYGKTAQESEWLDSSSTPDDLGSVQGLAQQASELQPKDHEVWTRNPLQGYVFYQIQEKQDSQARPFEEVREIATTQVQEKLARELAQQKGAGWLTELQNEPTALERIAEELELEVATIAFNASTRFLPEIGDNPEFRKLSLKLDDSNPAAVSVYEGRTDLIVFNRRFVDVEDPDTARERIRTNLRLELQRAIETKQIEALRSTAMIEVVDPVFRTTEP